MLAWRVYYDDGGTFSWGHGPPEAAPRTGVVAVRWMDGQNAPLTDWFHDFYWSESNYGGWDGDTSAFGQHGPCPRPLVLFGRSVLTASFREIVAR